MGTSSHEYERSGFKFKTEARPEGKDWYEWRVWVEGPAQKLGEVKEVEYILHPTYPERFHHRENAGDGFQLRSEGWGEFDIIAKITLASGEQQTVKVPLKLT